jgi:peptidyl-prolyl cis-trans isomerase C
MPENETSTPPAGDWPSCRGIMRTMQHGGKWIILLSLLVIGIASGCTGARLPSASPSAPGATPQPTTPAATPTPAPPTATPVPLAARVNGEGIPLAAFQASLAQLQKADADLKKTVDEAAQRKRVLDDLVSTALLAQAAKSDGYSLSDGDLEAKMSELAGKIGGDTALEAWEAANGYTAESLREALRGSYAAAWERDRILAQVPDTADQVHAQQILVSDEATAQGIPESLQSGSKFASLALKYDPATGGDLGWFPKGYLTAPEVETAAFSLQPGQTSEIIKSSLGYHIIQVIERDPQHPLSPDAKLTLQQAALKKWLEDRRAQSQVETLIQ